MTSKPFSQLLSQFLRQSDHTAVSLAKGIRLETSTVQNWLNGRTVPQGEIGHDDIHAAANFLQLTAPETDQLLAAAGFDAELTNQPDPPQTNITYNFNAPVTGAAFGGGSVQAGTIIGSDWQGQGGGGVEDPTSALWQLPRLTEVIGRNQERVDLLAAYNTMRDTGRGTVWFILGPPSSGRFALTDWLRQEVSDPKRNTAGVLNLAQLDPRTFGEQVRQQARQHPTLLIIDRIDNEDSVWLDAVQRVAQEIGRADENLPVMLLVIANANAPLENLTGSSHTEPTRLAQKLVREGLAQTIFTGTLTRQQIEDDLHPIAPDLLARLYDLSNGVPYSVEVLWQEWQQVHAVQKDNQGIWQAANVPAERLSVYGSVKDWALRYLENLCTCWEELDPPYTLAETEAILCCAASEGPVFTAEAVAAVLNHDPNELIRFLIDFLTPYQDDEDPTNNEDGIIQFVDTDCFDPVQPERCATLFTFARPIFYEVWRRSTTFSDADRQTWRHTLAVELDMLYYPYGGKIADKLARLSPGIAEPYRQLQGRNASLEVLRWQVNMLRHDDLSNKHTAYRLFDIGFRCLYRLHREHPELWEEGLDIANHLLHLAQENQDIEHEALAHTHIGLSLKDGGQYLSSWPHYQRALELNQAHFGPEHTSTGSCLNDLGILYNRIGMYKEAQKHFEDTLTILKMTLGSKHPSIATVMSNIGTLLASVDKNQEAKMQLEHALAIFEKVLGRDHPMSATALNNLGRVLIDLKEFYAAEQYINRALAIREAYLGPEHRDTAISLDTLGQLLREQGNIEGARPYYERALAIYESTFGPNHPDTKNARRTLQSLQQRIEGDG